MKAELIIDGRTIKIELTEEQVELIKENTKWPQQGDDYWYINDIGKVFSSVYMDLYVDYDRRDLGNIFKTEREAEDAVRVLTLIQAIRRDRLKINGSWTPDWSRKDETKYSLVYDYYQEALEIDQTTTPQVANVFGYYKSSLDAELIIGRYLPDLEWYFTEFAKERGQRDEPFFTSSNQ